MALLITLLLVVAFFAWITHAYPAPTFLLSVKRAADAFLSWFLGAINGFIDWVIGAFRPR